MIERNTFAKNCGQLGESVNLRWPRLRAALDRVYEIIDNISRPSTPQGVEQLQGAKRSVFEPPDAVCDRVSDKNW
jgi:hypothetical protein